MNREYNPKILRELDRLCIYKCNNCRRILFTAFDVKDGKMPVTCRACGHYIDGDRDIIGDSWYVNEFPEVRFTIDDTVEKGKKTRLLVWFHMECPDCHQMSWIAWREKWFDYMTCACHEPQKKEEAASIIPVPTASDTKCLVIEELIIPGELIASFKDYCFTNDITRKDAIIEAIRKLLENG
jgi:DNA-directed RNA polymerase subunit RPC12/RpoP